MAQVGVEPTASDLLRVRGLPFAYRAISSSISTRRGSRTLIRTGLSRAALPIGVTACLQAPGAGIEPNVSWFRARCCSHSTTPESIVSSSSSGRRNCTLIAGFKDRRLELLVDPREHTAGVEPACPAWRAGAWTARPGVLVAAEGEGVEPSRAFASSRFERGAVASRLALPKSASGEGLEPPTLRLTGARSTFELP